MVGLKVNPRQVRDIDPDQFARLLRRRWVSRVLVLPIIPPLIIVTVAILPPKTGNSTAVTANATTRPALLAESMADVR